MPWDGGMTDVETPTRGGTALVPGAHRIVRALDGRDGPFAGVLVAAGGARAVQVEAGELEGWAGWRFSGAEHVAAPLDVVRHADGHHALLPWCTESLAGFVARRSDEESGLGAGECATMVVSLLRGIEELGDELGSITGRWWLTDRGRPVFVIGAGTDARVEAADVVECLIAHCEDRARLRVLSSVRDGLQATLPQPHVSPRLLQAWERDVLADAAPRPLSLERARGVPAAQPRVSVRPSVAHPPPTRRSARGTTGARGAGERGAGLIVGRLRARVGRAWEAARARHSWRSPTRDIGRGVPRGSAATPGPGAPAKPPRRRARLVIVATAAAAAVLTVGLLWPDGASEAEDVRDGSPGAGGVASGEGAPPSDVVSEVDGERPVRDGSDAPDPPDDAAPDDAADSARSLPAAATSLVQAIGACRDAGDPVCGHAVATGAAGVIDALADTPDRDVDFTLVDEYGDVAVVRLTATSAARSDDPAAPAVTEQMLVLVRQNDEWLVRDVYDVADQPR